MPHCLRAVAKTDFHCLDMSKAHRGTGIRELPNQGKATCPVCKRENVKCLYEVEVEGAKANVCKQCNAKLKK